MKLSIIVLCYNAISYTQRCLESILQNTTTDYELIIIDNNSEDQTPEWLAAQEWPDNVQVILNKENRGVAGGRNQGISLAKGDFITFLDNDTEVSEGWEDVIFSEFKNKKVGVVGKTGNLVLSLRPLIFRGPRSITRECDVVPGFCLTFRRELIELIGNQWEEFPNPRFWHEDLEFCQRVKLAGYTIVYNPRIPIVHHEHKSMKGSLMSAENQFGYHENAEFIADRLKKQNVLYIYRDYIPNDISAYGNIIRQLSEELRKLGLVVIRKPGKIIVPRSLALCTAINMEYNGEIFRYVFQENDRPPKDWKVGFENVDYILAGSRHVAEALKGEDYSDKIEDFPLAGISDVYNMKVKPMSLHPKQFKFLTVGASQPRKGTLELLECYYEAFKGRKDVVLIIKDGDYGKRDATQLAVKKLQKLPDCPPIDYYFDSLTEEELATMYRSVAENGCYVHPHKAEGFGLTCLEAIACGCPVGITNWGGPKYNLEGIKTVTFFDYKLVPSSFHNWEGEPFYAQGEKPQWAEPDKSDVIKFMRDAVKQKYSKQEIQEASKTVIKKFSYSHIAKELYEFLTQYED